MRAGLAFIVGKPFQIRQNWWLNNGQIQCIIKTAISQPIYGFYF